MVQAQMTVVDGMGIWAAFNRKTSSAQVVIFHYAIDSMKSDCTRSKTQCVALAMGYQEIKPGLWMKIN